MQERRSYPGRRTLISVFLMAQITKSLIFLEPLLNVDSSFTQGFSKRSNVADGLLNRLRVCPRCRDEFCHGSSMFGDHKMFTLLDLLE